MDGKEDGSIQGLRHGIDRKSCTVENHDSSAARDEGEERARGWWY